jgi:iron complex outermembrane recepter protein
MNYRANNRLHAAALAATMLAVGASVVHAQEEAAPGTALSEIIVTGTRQAGLEAADSPAPIQILSPAALEAAAGNPDLMQTLAQIVPSLTVQGFANDMANQTVQYKLKGLSPNHVLVLVNGKRRHGTANLAIDGQNTYQGGAGADINFIPAAAIDHIEVLTDGAAAQYGSDAIAGVVNIILKSASSGGTVTGTYGADYDGGEAGNTVPWSFNGNTNATAVNLGFEPMDGAFFNITGEIHNHGHTFRGGADSRQTDPSRLDVYPTSDAQNAPGWPYVNWIEGDAETHSKIASYNSGWDLGGGTEVYSFGTYGTKEAQSFQNYRNASVLAYTNPATMQTTYPFPFGFDPSELDQENDYASTIGIKGVVASWNWDLSTTWGRDHHDVYTINSGNPGLYDSPPNGVNTTGEPSPRDFYDGDMIASQWTNTLDINRDFDVGMAGPLNVAFGAEFRKDWYVIGAGQPEAYLGGGPSSFAGFGPTDQGDNSRTNYAVYIDLAGKPIDALRFDIAGRQEHFSDFGNATVGKLTARYDFAPEFAVRGTISNGFRAPTLAEEYYSSTNVGPSSTDVQLPPDGAGAKVLGLGALQPEKSSSIQLGFVFRPLPIMSATLDVYRIRVTNRIVGSGTLNGLFNGAVASPLVNATIDATGDQINPVDINTGINLFTNGINTTTDGADLTFQFPVDYAVAGHVDYTVSATVNDTEVTYIRPVPADLVSALGGFPIYSPETLSDISEANPKWVVNLGAAWTLDKFTVNVLDKIYGPAHEYEADDGDNPTLDNSAPTGQIYYKSTLGVQSITNIDLAFQYNTHFKVSIGANNVFNKFPGLMNPALISAWNSHTAALNNDASSSAPVPFFSPYGIDGGFYYIRGTFKF